MGGRGACAGSNTLTWLWGSVGATVRSMFARAVPHAAAVGIFGV